jgi:hypothetical protein
MRVSRKTVPDIAVGTVRFRRQTLLTPGEQDVLRRFCSALPALPRLPTGVAAFGSRARGDANEQSDLDVAVLFDGTRDREVESKLSAIALAAQRAYWLDGYAIALRPVALYRDEASPFLEAIREDLEPIWTRP